MTSLPTPAKQVETLPGKPGVYKFLDEAGEALYIGKARNLKIRVASYFTSKNAGSRRITLMISRVRQISYTIVSNEYDAFLLENSLIKKYQPRYNVQLKDGKTYPYIVVKNERFPRIFSTRRMVDDGSEYFGPYASVGNMHTVLDLIRKLIPIRSCHYDLSEKNIRAGKFRVCLDYHINLCKGPCEGLQPEAEYNENIRNIREILKGNTSKVIAKLKKSMDEAVKNLEFEKAQKLKKKIRALEIFQAKSTVVNPKIKNVDVYSIYSQKRLSIVNYMKVVNGAIIQTHTIEYRKKLEEKDADIILLAVAELRKKFNSRSPEIILPFRVDFHPGNLKITVPQIGDKKKLLELSRKNAFYYLQDKRKQARVRMPKSEKAADVLKKVKLDLGLNKHPKHIECFDNSNLQGSNPVAAMVCFKNAQPSKADYRHFNIKTVSGPNDFASMEEVVYRRYSRLLSENKPLPQLVIIDGGKGQMNAALKSLVKLEVENEVHLIGIAKRLEEIYKPNDPYPLALDKRSPSLKLIQKMRNEAHRFGINHHRSKRSKNTHLNELEQIDGIGPKTAQKLLTRFHSVKKVKKAPLPELVNLVGKEKAEKVITHFLKKS